MAVTAYSGGEMTLRGMAVWNRQEEVQAPEPPAPEPTRYRLTVEKEGLEPPKWPRATSTSRADLLDLLAQLEGLGYSLVSLERLASPEPTAYPG